MEKINLVELLKDCPSGMELDCVSYDNVSFDKISDDKKAVYPIFCYITDKEGNRSGISFTENGCESKRYGAKCVIFPKDKNTWKGFHRPFVEGDVVSTETGMYIGIVKSTEDSHECCTFCSVHGKQDFHVGRKLFFSRLATTEEKQIMFDIIKANGYRWNPETKTLEKLPKFKVGDRIRHKNNTTIIKTIGYIYSDSYALYDGRLLYFKEQDEWELVPNKFDINTLKPFESKVLVRTENSDIWEGDIFVRYDRNATINKFHCIGGWYEKCIPFKGNEWLLGTTDDCNDDFKTWE